MGRARRAWTRGDIRASAAGLGTQGKRGQGSSGHRGRLLAWRVRPLALLSTERRHARGQVRAEQGRHHPRGRAAGGVRGKEEEESCSVGPAWQRLRVEGSEVRWWCWAGLCQGAAERAGLGQVGRAGEAGPAVQAGPDARAVRVGRAGRCV